MTSKFIYILYMHILLLYIRIYSTTSCGATIVQYTRQTRKYQVLKKRKEQKAKTKLSQKQSKRGLGYVGIAIHKREREPDRDREASNNRDRERQRDCNRKRGWLLCT